MEAAVVFLYDKGRSGTVEDSTMEAYEASARAVLEAGCRGGPGSEPEEGPIHGSRCIMSILFVDESKTKGYTMIAALVVPGDVASLRRDVRSLVLPGQRRIHFTKEQPERKRLILSRLTSFGAQA